jgi:ribonuclease HI
LKTAKKKVTDAEYKKKTANNRAEYDAAMNELAAS